MSVGLLGRKVEANPGTKAADFVTSYVDPITGRIVRVVSDGNVAYRVDDFRVGDVREPRSEKRGRQRVAPSRVVGDGNVGDHANARPALAHHTTPPAPHAPPAQPPQQPVAAIRAGRRSDGRAAVEVERERGRRSAWVALSGDPYMPGF